MSKTIIIICLFSVLILETIALYKGVNGKALALAIGVFGSVVGYWIHYLKTKRGG